MGNNQKVGYFCEWCLTKTYVTKLREEGVVCDCCGSLLRQSAALCLLMRDPPELLTKAYSKEDIVGISEAARFCYRSEKDFRSRHKRGLGPKGVHKGKKEKYKIADLNAYMMENYNKHNFR